MIDSVIKKTGVEPRDYQRNIVKKTVDLFTGKHVGVSGHTYPAAKSVMIEAPTGCVAGDTVLHFNNGGKGFKMTIQDAFVHFNGGDPDVESGKCMCGCGQDTRVPTKDNKSKGQFKDVPNKYVHGHQSRGMKWNEGVQIRSFVGDEMRLQPFDEIVRSGVKPVLEMILDDGKKLRATACHPILTENGWVPLGDLKNGDAVFIDVLKPQKSDNEHTKIRDSHICNLWNHPFGRSVQTTKSASGYTVRIPQHVAVFEAHHNNLTMDEYIAIMREGNPDGLSLVDPTVFVIHHKDGNHSNNDPSNLQMMTITEHNQHHGAEHLYQNFGNFVPATAKVVSITPAGECMTYDVRCPKPYHNFVANGIVVHNSGKTVMAHLIAKSLEEIHGDDVAFGWVAMRSNLLTQAAHENRDLGINVKNIHYVSMFNKRPDDLLQAKRDGKKVVMIVDEAQHDASSSSANLHNLVEPEMILGLTATPFRTDKVKLCFDHIVKDAGIHRLIQDGYLSKYRHFTIPEWTPEAVADHYCAEPERWGKSVVFFFEWQDVERFKDIIRERESEIMARLRQTRPDLRLDRSLVETVRGGGSKSDYDARDRLLSDFDNGDVGILANCVVLTEGFDAPTLETAFVRDSSKGPTMQMAGRAFRVHPQWKNAGEERFKLKNVVQSVLTRYPILKTALPAEQYIWRDDNWISLTINPHIDKINSRCRMAIAQTQVHMPEFIQKRKSKKRVVRF